MASLSSGQTRPMRPSVNVSPMTAAVLTARRASMDVLSRRERSRWPSRLTPT